MQCADVRQVLRATDGNVAALPTDLQAHLQHCGDCREYAEDREFAQLLHVLPVMDPPPGFTDRALQQAWRNREMSKTTAEPGIQRLLAIAATLVLTTGVALMSFWPERETGPAVSQQIVQVAPFTVRQVDLLMVSAVDLPQAWITLRMDSNVNLAGYPADRELRWPASLVAGNNQLTLPVELQGTDSGFITIEVESNGAQKEMMLTVNAINQQRSSLLFI